MRSRSSRLTRSFKLPRNSALYTLRSPHLDARHRTEWLSARFRALRTVPTLRQTAVFLLRWTVVGLAGAGLLLLIRPGLIGTTTTAASNNSALPTADAGEPRRSFADAVRRAGPAVVNIYTARVVDAAAARPSDRNPLLQQHL